MGEQRAVAALKLDPDWEAEADEAVHISSFVVSQKGNRILLARAKDFEGKEKWFIPGEMLYWGEDPEDGARRVVAEWFRGVEARPRLREIQSHTGHAWDLCFVYEANIPQNAKPASDVSELKWFPRNKVPLQDMGHEHEDVLATMWAKRARPK